jgi:hypothetical protein
MSFALNIVSAHTRVCAWHNEEMRVITEVITLKSTLKEVDGSLLE